MLQSTRPALLHSYEHHHLAASRWHDFEVRPDDIIISTSYKAGTTWMQTIVGNIIFQEAGPPAPIGDLSPWLDMRVVPEEQMKQALAAASSAGKDLHEALKKGAEECAQTSSKLASAARESDRLRKKLEDVRGERDGLVQKSRDFERVLAEKGSLETRLAMAAEVAMAQEEAIAGLEKKLEEA